MRKILLVVSLSLFATAAFAQKKAVKDAKSEASKNASEARALIKPALTNPETMNDPETWFVAGDIEFKAFEKERDAEMLKEFSADKKGGNEENMYTGLYNMYVPYLKADSLGQLPDAKGKVKNKFRKDIIKNFKVAYPFHINAGAYYNEKRDYAKATEFFERYWNIPTLEIFKDDKEGLGIVDSTMQTIKYYAVLTAIQSGNQEKSIRLLNRIIEEGYIPNSTYKESDPYELLASEYQQTGDSANFIAILKSSAQKFPSNQYFTPNLINEFIKAGKRAEAIDYIDQAIANDPSNACNLYTVKGTLFIDSDDQKNYDEAEKAYQQALSTDPNCERALEGVGVLNVLKAQDVKEKAGQTTNRREQVELDKQTADLYQVALPYLEKYYNLLKARNAESYDVRQSLIKLQNVYYNLSLLNVDKSKEYDAATAELEALKDM